MAFNPITDNGRELAPAGSQVAVITALVDAGTQKRKKWKVPAKDTAASPPPATSEGEWEVVPETVVVLELTNRPLRGSTANYELCVHIRVDVFGPKSHQRKLAEAALNKRFATGEPFDIRTILGKALQVKVVHKPSGDRVYANISEFMPLAEEMKHLVKPPQRSPLLWEIETGDLNLLDDLPRLFGETLRDVVAAAPEWRQRAQGTPARVPPRTPPAPGHNSSVPQPPPRKPKPAPPPSDVPVRLWVYPQGEGDATLMTVEDLRRYCFENQLDPAQVEVCRETHPDKLATAADFIGASAAPAF
jgi:hypothetical protein